MTYNDVKNYYDKGLWTEEMVKDAVEKGVITTDQYETISGKAYAYAALNSFLKKTWMFSALKNYNFTDSISGIGDTVDVNVVSTINLADYSSEADMPDSEQVLSDGTAVTIDKGFAYNFTTRESDGTRLYANFVDVAMQDVASSMKAGLDTYSFTKITAGAGERTSSAVPTGGIYELIVMLKMALDEKMCPREGRILVTCPAVEAELLLDSRYGSDKEASHKPLLNGSVGRCCGFDLFLSNDTIVADKMICASVDGLAFAYQLNHAEEDNTMSGVFLCGFDLIKPEWVYVHTLTG